MQYVKIPKTEEKYRNTVVRYLLRTSCVQVPVIVDSLKSVDLKRKKKEKFMFWKVTTGDFSWRLKSFMVVLYAFFCLNL
jgi:hypothetical protein